MTKDGGGGYELEQVEALVNAAKRRLVHLVDEPTADQRYTMSVLAVCSALKTEHGRAVLACEMLTAAENELESERDVSSALEAALSGLLLACESILREPMDAAAVVLLERERSDQ